jgi:hypothetical protein
LSIRGPTPDDPVRLWPCDKRLDPASQGQSLIPRTWKESAVVRRYEEPIEVRAAGEQALPGDVPAGGSGAPAAFLWRGRLYVVRQVLDHWKERRPWWRDALEERRVPSVVAAGAAGAAFDVLGDARERQVWRVEASAGRMAGTGVYDLGVDPSPGQWRLLRVAD